MLRSLEDLADLRGKDAAAAIRLLAARTEDTVVEGRAMAALIRVGDYSRLDRATEYLQSEPDSDRAVGGAKTHMCVWIAFVTDPNFVPRLYPLLKHPRPLVRSRVARAVRHARLRSAVPHLIEGLKDEDQDTRYQCLMGLAETTGRITGSPSKGLFVKDEERYIRSWQTWWEHSGRAEYLDLPQRADEVESLELPATRPSAPAGGTSRAPPAGGGDEIARLPLPPPPGVPRRVLPAEPRDDALPLGPGEAPPGDPQTAWIVLGVAGYTTAGAVLAAGVVVLVRRWRASRTAGR